MRIKTYTAPSMEKAISLLRREMGPEAIILSSQTLENGDIQLTAAVEQLDAPPAHNTDSWAADWDRDWRAETDETPPQPASAAVTRNAISAKAAPIAPERAQPIRVTPKMEVLVQSMAYHGLPTRLAEMLCRTALATRTDNPEMALAAAFDSHFTYSSRISGRKAPMMLVGPPGVGKTVTIAKFAAAAKLEGREFRIITTDMSRAGAIEQLKAYTDILGFDLDVAETPEALKALLESGKIAPGADILIDTGGINIYDAGEVAALTRYIIAGRAEPVVVLAAGTDTAEMSDTAEGFAALGARRMIVTRLDTTRRYGGIFTAAQSARLSFSYASVSPSVASGLHKINPVNLARILLRDPTRPEVGKEFDKVRP